MIKWIKFLWQILQENTYNVKSIFYHLLFFSFINKFSDAHKNSIETSFLCPRNQADWDQRLANK